MAVEWVIHPSIGAAVDAIAPGFWLQANLSLFLPVSLELHVMRVSHSARVSTLLKIWHWLFSYNYKIAYQAMLKSLLTLCTQTQTHTHTHSYPYSYSYMYICIGKNTRIVSFKSQQFFLYFSFYQSSFCFRQFDKPMSREREREKEWNLFEHLCGHKFYWHQKVVGGVFNTFLSYP